MATETQESPRFIVDPREGTVAGPGGTVRLEPKVMQVLTVLSRHPGRVVSRTELLDAVWPDVVVTEHTLSRCIYQLRHELGRIGAGPGPADYNPIETLPKRGYRLLSQLETVPDVDSPAPEAFIAAGPVIPFVVGQWVRGDRFYGRAAQIREILDGHRNTVWLLGTRRIGKTSLLKQIEYITASPGEARYFPIFWDFQGADTPEELHFNFTDALMDADERLERVGIPLDQVRADDLFVSVEQLRRQLRSRRLKLLLLCDEVEELIKLHRNHPSLLRKLRHTMQSRDDIRAVLASTIRLWLLADQSEDTSPFLHGFTPPLYIERFSDDEARSLIEQSHIDAEYRPNFPADVIGAIGAHCDNHPYLLQLVCKRYLETGSLDEAIEQVATDRMVSYFFSVDFDMLSHPERNIVESIARRSGTTGDSIRADLALGADEFEGTLRRLQNLGFVRRDGGHEVVLANYFFRRWLQATQQAIAAPAEAASSVAIESEVPKDVGSDAGHETSSVFSELRRRNVFRVGAAYVVTAWVLLQLGDIVFEFLEVPVWAGKLLIVFLALGLPVALVFAWAFELTPEGLKRDREIDRSVIATARTGHKLDTIIIAALLIAVLYFIFDKFV